MCRWMPLLRHGSTESWLELAEGLWRARPVGIFVAQRYCIQSSGRLKWPVIGISSAGSAFVTMCMSGSYLDGCPISKHLKIWSCQSLFDGHSIRFVFGVER